MPKGRINNIFVFLQHDYTEDRCGVCGTTHLNTTGTGLLIKFIFYSGNWATNLEEFS